MALRDTVKKVDRAVARLEELQSTLSSRDSSQGGSRSTKVSTAQRLKIDKKVEVLEEIHARKREAREGRRWSEAGAASGSKGALRDGNSGKENAGSGVSAVKKKRRKRLVPGGVNAPVAAGARRRQVLSNRSSNVAVDFAGGRGDCSPSTSSSRSDNESRRRRRVQATTSEDRRKERPPWCNYTSGAATARYAGAGYSDGGGQPPSGDFSWRPTSAVAASRRRSGATLAPASHATPPPRPKSSSSSSSLAAAGISCPRSKTPRPTPSVRPGAVKNPLHRPFPRTFHVDVRSNPNRPWFLSSSNSVVPAAPVRSIKSPRHGSSPVVLFPNSAFAPQSATAGADRAKPAPFRSFQLKPLKLPARISPTHNSPAATIRPYLSPSKVLLSPKQSPRQSVTPPQPTAASIDDLLCNTAACSTAKLEKKKQPDQHQQNWLTRRFSLPSAAAASSSCTRRFSLLARRDESCSAKPLPSLITRLPARHKAREPPFSLSKQQPSAPMGHPNPVNAGISPPSPQLPLPLPPALSCSSSHQRSNSCPRQQLRSLDSNSPLRAGGSDEIEQVKEIMAPGISKRQTRQLIQGHGKENISRIGSCNSVALDCEGGRRKVHCGAFSNCGTASAWPSVMKRSWSFSHQRGHDCTSNCTGAGPFLLKHMKSWVHNNNKSPHVDICRMDSFTTFRSP